VSSIFAEIPQKKLMTGQDALKIRMLTGLSQTRFGALIGGRTRNQVSYWETDTPDDRLDDLTAREIARVFPKETAQVMGVEFITREEEGRYRPPSIPDELRDKLIRDGIEYILQRADKSTKDHLCDIVVHLAADAERSETEKKD
jgi:transcriptional regulator with XRE-family HTH domain